tara:strand:+ start:1204 stop:1503 length:300 start_codon:yes stop_codon:yes gene_type:complete
MALATRKSGNIHSKTGSDLLSMKAKYDANSLDKMPKYDDFQALLYQLQLLREDIDELRRYIASDELLETGSLGGRLPNSDPRARGRLWNNNGVVSVSRG